MKKTELACLMGMICALTTGIFAKDAQTLHGLENDVLRLHILANSDTADDQLLKYAVRDAILEEGSTYFTDMTSCADAKATAAGCLPQLEEIARRTVAAYGYDYEVTAVLSEVAFDERVYDAGTMPAGVYDAVQVRIGAAEGQNWWCVMYPPLCLPAAAEDAEPPADVFTEEEREMLENPQKFRFRLKILELLEKWMDSLCE